MKEKLAAIICTILISTLAPALTLPGAGDGKLTPDEKAKAIKMLIDSEKEFLSYVEKLSDAQWNARPIPFKWTVGETAEHIALSEGLLFSAMERALAAPINPDWETKSAGKGSFWTTCWLPARESAAPNPSAAKRKMSRADIIALQGRSRKVDEVYRIADRPLKAHTLDHPFPVFGTLNAYQWFLYIPAHNLRHNKQIAEVMNNPAFPK
jgi:hypothetical protein